MTEKSLLLKCDVADHYFMVGTDFPAARIFDTATSSLAAVVELPLRSRTVSLAALTLTAVAIRRCDESGEHANAKAATTAGNGAGLTRHRTEALLANKVAAYYAAVGLSNGTVLLHDVRRDVPLAHVQVSETQQPIVSLQISAGYVFCLAANHTLYAMRIRDAGATGPCLRLRVQPDASAIAVTAVAANTANAHEAFRVLVAGPTNALYEVRTLASRSAAAEVPQVQATKLVAFPSQGTSAEFAWVSDAASASGGALPAITASAQDGVVRVWDVQHAAPSALPGTANGAVDAVPTTARCRRTLICGQRILNVSVLPAAAAAARAGNYVMVTTLTGSVLLWSLGEALLPAVVEPVPLRPDVVLVSAVAAGRLLFGALRSTAARSGATSDAASPLRALEMTLLRGRFALPLFESINIGDAVERVGSAAKSATTKGATKKHKSADEAAVANTRQAALATLALGIAGTTAVTVAELPLSAAHAAAMQADQRDADYLLQHTTDAATSSFVVLDTVWAAHQHQVAAKATQSMTEAFRAPQLYHANSIQDLPVKQFTLEQRLQQVARDEAAAALRRRHKLDGAVDGEDDEGGDAHGLPARGAGAKIGRSVVSHHALGLATVPLYQALHAGDTSAVMDLLNMSARSAEGMRATVLSLQLPYCLQLLHVISERLGLCSKAVERVAQEPPLAAPKTGADATISGGATPGSDAAAAATVPADASSPADNNGQETDASGSDAAALRGGSAAFSIRSSLLEWVDAIVHYRGSELLAVQRDWNARRAAGAVAPSTSEAGAVPFVSPPKDFLAPILHHYEALCTQYDKLAVLYGRLSVFKAVRPSQKNEFTNVPRKSLASNLEMGRPGAAAAGGAGLSSSSGSNGGARGAASKHRLHHLAQRSSVVDDDIIFPVMFKESRARSGHRVVRVRSKLDIAKQRRLRETRDGALQKRARALAQEQLRRATPGQSILDEDDGRGAKRGGLGGVDFVEEIMMAEMAGKDGELDLDALEAMDLADDDGSEANDALSETSADEDASSEGGADDEEEGDDDDPTAPPRKVAAKKARREAGTTDAMLADAAEEAASDDDEDEDAALDTSEAEFSSGSDDELDSDAAGAEDSDDEEDEDEDEVGSEGNDEGSNGGSDEADASGDSAGDGDDDDGMDDNMRELLARHEDDEDRTERRKAKKVRTD